VNKGKKLKYGDINHHTSKNLGKKHQEVFERIFCG